MYMFSGLSGAVLKTMLLGTAAFVLYFVSDHNALLSLIGAGIGPAVTIAWYRRFPLRPYRGEYYDKSMHDVDPHDPVVMRLVALLGSGEAFGYLVRKATVVWGVVFLFLYVATRLLAPPVRWSPQAPPGLFWGLVPLVAVITFSVISASYSEWGVRTRAAREAPARHTRAEH